MTSKTGRPSFSASSTALLAVPYSVTPGESRNFDLTTSSQNLSSGSTADPPYLFSQLKSAEWLRRYGLKSQKLTFDQILQQIGFKRVESFDPVIGKTITPKYAGNLYHEVQHDNGDRYVLTCRPEKLREYHTRLTRLLNLLRKRLLFLTNGSRRLFGIIGEPSVCLICDCKTFDYRLFNQFQTALTSLFKEQISKLKRFNIIWVSNDNEQFRDQPVDVNSTTIDQAIDWICDRKCPKTKISISSTSEAVLKAFTNNIHSIYLISEGDSSDLAREILRDNIVKTRLSMSEPIPFHVISLFCNNNDTQTFLRSIAQSADGSYFCYKIKTEMSDLKAPSNLYDPTRIKLQDDKLQMGTNALTPSSEYPLDITLMYKEIIQCQSIIDRIEKILGFIRDENQNPVHSFDSTKSVDAFHVSGENNFQRSLIVQSSALFNAEDGDMSSSDWLKSYGIDAQKLDFFSVLQAAAFRHCDGVVTVLKPPTDSSDVTAETPAKAQDKLINAIYCDQFAHVAWPDGTIRHVHVTPELYRDYERRMKALLEKLRARLLWLKKGSRDLFGTVLENNIYLLIDTSKSMEHHLGFVKDKLRLLIKDQLFAKERINMVAFNSVINPWRDRLTKINDSVISSQLQPWIDGLNAEGSTNTLGALRFALADPGTEAIYLLSDGRPDQNERHILSQVQYRQVVPIHTISFNCQDQSANQFLYDLSKQTGGRFHTYQYGLEKGTTIELPESEDVGYLKNEFERGEKELERVAALRDECLGRAWATENPQSKSSKYKLQSTVVYPLKNQMHSRPHSSSMEQKIRKKKRPISKQKTKQRSKSVDQVNGFNLDPNQWLIPEIKTTDQPTKLVETKSISKTPDDEVKSYLKKNSLLAKGLTIFDVLHPTSTTVRNPLHVQTIDRYVLAKIWDELLPLAYGPYLKKLRLINHYAVDLVKYEDKLKELIANYYNFTSNFIWKYINDDEKRKIGPYLHWNQLSKHEQNQISQEITKEEHTSESALEDFAWRKLTDDEQNTLLERPPSYQNVNRTLLKNALKNSDSDLALKGVSRMDTEIQRALKFLQISTHLRQLQIRADIETKATTTENKPKPKAKRKSSYDRSVGQRVICRFDDDGFFYPGSIQRDHRHHTIVQFDIGINQNIVGHTLLPTNGAIAQPPLLVNDPVLVRQLNNQAREFWAPGRIVCLPSTVARSTPLYTVIIYTPSPHQVHVLRRDLFKITDTLFNRTIVYIQSVDNPPIPPPNDSDTTSSLRDTLRNELDPLKKKVDRLEKTHKQRYHEVKETLDDLTGKIKNLQQEPPKTSVQPQSTQTIEISIDRKPPTPQPPTPTSSRKSSSTASSQPSDRLTLRTEVYALWSEDDSLVYKGIVLSKPDQSNRYLIQRNDLPNNQYFISRDDIYLQKDCVPLRELKKPQTCILIKHPEDSRHCWMPAVILPDSTSSSKHIRFYDCFDRHFPSTEHAIEITKEKFQEYSILRIEFENRLLNQTIVGLNEEKNAYLLGTIEERMDTGHRYLIHWCDHSKSEQNEEHIFGEFAWHRPLKVNDYVLALDEQQIVYKPGKVIQLISNEKVKVQYLNSDDENREATIETIETFVITEEYCENAIQKLNSS